MTMKIQLDWKRGLRFDAESSSGAKLTMDAETGEAPSPMEALLASLAGCMAMDVASILEKKRQSVASYRIEIEGERPEAGVYPRPFTAVRMRHIVTGDSVDPEAVRRAIELSETKYCSVAATLKGSPEILSTFDVLETVKPGT